MPEALRRVQPTLLSDMLIEQEWVQEPRSLSEIVDTIDELVTKVWYDRHQLRRQRIEEGKIKIVDKETFPIQNRTEQTIQRDIWE